MVQPGSGDRFPVLVLMGEEELTRRENELRAMPDVDPAQLQYYIHTLNGPVRRMAVDAQRRIVLPAHFVDYLKLEREVYMYSTNVTVLAWHPDDWRRYSSTPEAEDGGLPPPLPFLSV